MLTKICNQFTLRQTDRQTIILSNDKYKKIESVKADSLLRCGKEEEIC